MHSSSSNQISRFKCYEFKKNPYKFYVEVDTAEKTISLYRHRKTPEANWTEGFLKSFIMDTREEFSDSIASNNDVTLVQCVMQAPGTFLTDMPLVIIMRCYFPSQLRNPPITLRAQDSNSTIPRSASGSHIGNTPKGERKSKPSTSNQAIRFEGSVSKEAENTPKQNPKPQKKKKSSSLKSGSSGSGVHQDDRRDSGNNQKTNNRNVLSHP
uniref:Uncharacterized protein n=1 Tax=Schizaphis graminum TaxID=13262 RepID=A0A2S2N715_SCHGA